MSVENASGVYDTNRQPELADLLRLLKRDVKLTLRTHAPASVVVYDPVRQLATVQVAHIPVVRVVALDDIPIGAVSVSGTPPNAEATMPPIQLVDIPVAWPRTLAGYITFPLVPGDTGELHVSDRSMEAWRLAGIPTDPQLSFTHHLKDSVFHPGLHADTQPIVPPTDLTATVVEGAQIKLGRTAVSSLAKADILISAIDTALTAAVVAANAVTPPNGDGGSAALSAFQSAWDTAKTAIPTVKAKGE